MADRVDLVTAEPPAERRWQPGPILDQGREGACVGFGWTAWYNSEPVLRTFNNDWARQVYLDAQFTDPWADTPPAEGTSTQAGAKIMVERGALGTYVWAKTFSEAKTFVGLYGTVVVGTVVREGMYRPDAQGYVQRSGQIVGGHCYLLLGYKENGDLIFQNSWGSDYGDGGLFYMTEATFKAMLADGSWSMCSAAELAPPPPPPPPDPLANLPRYSPYSIYKNRRYREEHVVRADGVDKAHTKPL
jgi:hypothetical protein